MWTYRQEPYPPETGVTESSASGLTRPHHPIKEVT